MVEVFLFFFSFFPFTNRPYWTVYICGTWVDFISESLGLVGVTVSPLSSTVYQLFEVLWPPIHVPSKLLVVMVKVPHLPNFRGSVLLSNETIWVFHPLCCWYSRKFNKTWREASLVSVQLQEYLILYKSDNREVGLEISTIKQRQGDNKKQWITHFTLPHPLDSDNRGTR